MSEATAPVPAPAPAPVDRMLAMALRYALELKWAVIPIHGVSGDGCACRKGRDCPSPGKHPLTEHGVTEASKDEATIRAWWGRWPGASVAVATGAISGIWVLDVDGEPGSESLRALEREQGPLPETVEALTGGGGRHLVWTHPGKPVRNKVAVAPGLDVRGDGGYIVVPKSPHVSGRLYEWEAAHHPLDKKPLAAPEWLVATVCDPPAGNTDGQAPAGPVPETVLEGQGRNTMLTSLAGSMRSRGLSMDEMLPSLAAANAKRCVPPLPEDELRAIARSVARYKPAEQSRPDDEEDAEPAPVPDAPDPPKAISRKSEREYVIGKKGRVAVTDFVVEEVRRFSSNPPEYELTIRPKVTGRYRSPDSAVQVLGLTQEQYLSKSKFEAAFHAKFYRKPKLPTAPDQWRRVTNRWDARAVSTVVGADASEEDSLRAEIVAIVEGMAPGETKSDLERGQVVERDGKHYLSLRAVQAKLTGKRRELSPQRIGRCLSVLGLVPAGGSRHGVVRLPGGSIRAWVVPEAMRRAAQPENDGHAE